MKRTTLIAITVGAVLGTAASGAYAQTQSNGAVSPDQQQLPAPQANPPAVGSAGPRAPQTAAPAVGQAGPSAPATTPAVGQAGPGPAADEQDIHHRDMADGRTDRQDITREGADTAADRHNIDQKKQNDERRDIR